MRKGILGVMLVLCTWGAAAEEVTLVTELIERVRHARELLGPELSPRLQYAFDDKARTIWSFFPGEHPGVPLSSCNEEQQQALLECVRVALSASGFSKVETVRALDDVLAEDNPDSYSASKYFLSVWGEPGEKGPWSLRWEGHHLSLNWLIKEGRVMASTPQFIGSNPARVLEGPLKDTRAQSQEEDIARALIQSLSEEQRSKALAGDEAIADVITHMKSEAEAPEEAGISYADLEPEQQQRLRALIQVYVDVQARPIAEGRTSALEEESLQQTRFAWYGGQQPGEKHYYRIQNPAWVIEYANTQNNANHIHTTWHDYANDFGRNILREHLAYHHGEAFGVPW